MARILVVQHEHHAPIGTLGPPLAAHDLVVWRPDLGEPAPPLEALDGVLSLGGTPHPDHDDQHVWLAHERALLRAALAQRLPALGVCLGGQLLAQAAGGWAGPAAEPEIGWHDVDLTDAADGDPLLDGLPRSFPAFEWHHYCFTPPPGAALLARSGRAAQAFRAGERAWGLQFHVEVDQPIIEEWLAGGNDDLRAFGLDGEAIARESERNAPGYARVAEQVASRFGKLVSEHARARAAA